MPQTYDDVSHVPVPDQYRSAALAAVAAMTSMARVRTAKAPLNVLVLIIELLQKKVERIASATDVRRRTETANAPLPCSVEVLCVAVSVARRVVAMIFRFTLPAVENVFGKSSVLRRNGKR